IGTFTSTVCEALTVNVIGGSAASNIAFWIDPWLDANTATVTGPVIGEAVLLVIATVTMPCALATAMIAPGSVLDSTEGTRGGCVIVSVIAGEVFGEKVSSPP